MSELVAKHWQRGRFDVDERRRSLAQLARFRPIHGLSERNRGHNNAKSGNCLHRYRIGRGCGRAACHAVDGQQRTNDDAAIDRWRGRFGRFLGDI